MSTQEVESQLALDQELAALAAQRDDLSGLQSRAKDVVGLLTLAGTFIGAFGKERVDGVLVELEAGAEWRVWLFIAMPLITVGCCLFVMLPRSFWKFNLSGPDIAANIARRAPDVGFATADRVNLAYTTLIAELRVSNTEPIKRRMYTLWVALLALIVEVIVIVALVAY